MINYYYYNYYCQKHPRNIDIEFHLELLSGTLDRLPDTSDFFFYFLCLRLKDKNIYKSRLIGRGQSSRESTRQLHASKINLHRAANRVAFGL